ncbi:MAG: transposase family protein, partial [Thermonemataceae bacterium]|nr:transposase family protein [Thermonemataceae bacterium]
SYKRIGRPSKLSAEDKVLMMLEYNREYRTAAAAAYFHIGKSDGLAEGNAYKCIKQVEELLIKSGKFNLPKRTSLIGEKVEYEVLLIDATESKVLRPQKNSGVITVEKSTITT